MICPQHVTLSSVKIIQSVANHNEKNFMHNEKDEIIIETSNVYSSSKILGGIYKNIIPLYRLVMSKHQSSIELIATDKKRINEFPIKTSMFPFLPMLQNFKNK